MRHQLSSAEALGLLVATACFVLGTSLFAWISESAVGASVALLLAAAFVIGSITYAVRRGKRVTDVRMDDGGVRLSSRERTHYVSFAELKTAALSRSYGRVVLRLGTATQVHDYLLDAASDELQPQLEAAMREARARAPSGVDELARNGQPLDAWLARLRDLATPDYRARPVDPEALVGVIEDRTAPVELRAAAAHVLLWQRDHEKATRVMVMIGRATPPLVIVAATLATRDGTYVAEYEEALAYVSPADRAVAARMIDERPFKLRVSESESELAEVEAPVEYEQRRIPR